jgi:hypothetical protein
LLAKGLLVMLLGIASTPVIAQLAIAQRVAPTQKASQTDAIAKQLLGQWQAKDPKSNAAFTFIFAPNNTLFVVLPAADGSSIALKAAYQINPTTQPMQLDIQVSPEEKAATIFEFTTEGKFSGRMVTVGGICETNQPSTSPPAVSAVIRFLRSALSDRIIRLILQSLFVSF